MYAEAGAEPIVRTDVDVQAEAGQHPPRRLGLEQARGETARAADEHARDLRAACADAEARQRADARERAEQRGQQLGSTPA